MERPIRSIRRSVLAAFAVAVVAIAAAGYFYYRTDLDHVRQDRYEEIASIAELKAGQIQLWRQERVNDANSFAKRPLLRIHLEEWLRAGRPSDLRETLLEELQLDRESYRYSDAHILALNGTRLLSTDGPSDGMNEATRRAIARSMETHEPVVSDFFRVANGAMYVDTVSPILNRDGDPIAVLVFRTDARDYLFPLLQRWPTPSQSGETNLSQIQNNSVVLLNEPRFRPGQAMTLEFPMEHVEIPAVSAALGQEGLFEGVDYRGEPVIAYLMRVPDTLWSLVTKMDTKELMAESRYHAGVAALVVTLAILMAAVVTALIHRQLQVGSYREINISLSQAQEAMARSEERFRTVVEAAPDAIFIQSQQRFAYVNPALVELLGGTSADDFLGNAILDRFDPAFHEAIRKRMQILREEKRPVPAMEEVMLRLDGSLVHAEVSAAPIRYEGADGSLVFVRDITARIRAEEYLRESEERLRSIVNSEPECVKTVSINGTVLDINPAGLRMFEADRPEQVTGKPVLSVVVPEDQDAYLKLHEAVCRGETGQAQFRIRGFKGTTRWMETHSVPLRDRFGSVASVLSVTRDVTDRVKSDDILRESEQRYRNLFTANPHPMWINDLAEFRFLEMNDAALEHYGYTLDEFRSMTLEDLHLAEDLPRLQEYAERHADREMGRAGAWRHRRKDGTIIDVEVAWHLFDYKDTPAELVVAYDITERKQAEEALRAVTAQLQGILDHSPLLITVVSLDGRYLLINRASVDLFGVEPPDLIGKPFPELMNPDIAALFQERIETIRRTREPLYLEDRLELPQGERVFNTVLFPLYNATGEISAVGGIAQDITRRVRTEEEREQLALQYRQSQKMEAVGRLAGGIAHDFNNMLNVIIGHAELALVHEELPGDVRDDLNQILLAGKRSTDLTRQLLAFARRQTITPTVCDLNEMIGNMFAMLGRLIGEDIALQWHPGSDLWHVKMDAAQIDQIVINLVINARDSIAEHGEVSIATGNEELDEDYCKTHAGVSPGRFVRISISDTGCGMDRETLAQIFEPFFTTKPMGKGTGLGLSTVYGIIQQNGGSIQVYSEVDKGTTFRVYLPAHEAGGAPAIEAAAPTTFQRGTETVLVVEDEAILLSLVRLYLEQLGYTVVTANSPMEAIETAKNYAGDIHLLMTDVIMPEMNGRELCGEISAIRKDVKCLYMSGYTADIIGKQGVIDESIHFIEKPFSLMKLGAKMREALDG